MSAKEPTTTAEVLDDVTRKEHREAWDRTILGIAVFCGIPIEIIVSHLVNNNTHHEFWGIW